jgi:hypothetical protein
MPINLTATISLDRAVVEPLVREIVIDLLRDLLPAQFPDGQSASPAPAHYLVSSVHPKDVLDVVEAPDVTAGERNEPHWRIVQNIRRGDRIIFRNSRQKALVGMAVADRTEKGLHRHDPHQRVIRWWLTESVWFPVPISDDDFRGIFLKCDDGTAGFKLFRESGQFSQKTYAYPLSLAVAKAVLANAGVHED